MAHINHADALSRFSVAHRQGLALAERIAAAKDEDAISGFMVSVPSTFEREIEPHLRIEEGVLLVKLVAAGQTELVRHVMGRHQRLRELTEQIAAGDRASLQSFWMVLQATIRFEQQQVFTVAAALLPEYFPLAGGK